MDYLAIISDSRSNQSKYHNKGIHPLNNSLTGIDFYLLILDLNRFQSNNKYPVHRSHEDIMKLVPDKKLLVEYEKLLLSD